MGVFFVILASAQKHWFHKESKVKWWIFNITISSFLQRQVMRLTTKLFKDQSSSINILLISSSSIFNCNTDESRSYWRCINFWSNLSCAMISREKRAVKSVINGKTLTIPCCLPSISFKKCLQIDFDRSFVCLIIIRTLYFEQSSCINFAVCFCCTTLMTKINDDWLELAVYNHTLPKEQIIHSHNCDRFHDRDLGNIRITGL